MLVVIVLFAIMGSLVASASITTLRQTNHTQRRAAGSQADQTALDRISRDLRVADPVISAGTNDITILVARASGCTQHRYYLDAASRLLMTSQATSGATDCGGVQAPVGSVLTTVLLPATNQAGGSLFSYFQTDPTTKAQTAVSAPVASGGLSTISRIAISVAVTSTPGTRVVMTSGVDLRNNSPS
jgi:hypothetical protein